MGYNLIETKTLIKNTTKEKAEEAKKYYEKNYPEREYKIIEK